MSSYSEGRESTSKVCHVGEREALECSSMHIAYFILLYIRYLQSAWEDKMSRSYGTVDFSAQVLPIISPVKASTCDLTVLVDAYRDA